MLVLNRQNEMFTEVRITRENLQKALDRGVEPTLYFRVYNITAYGQRARTEKDGNVDIAFDDPPHFFDIERPERVEKKLASANISLK